MSRDCPDRAHIIREQQRMFRLAERDHGLNRKVLALESGIPADTLKSYATAAGGSEMPVSALRKLAKVDGFPLHLLSLLLDGTGVHFAPDEPGDDDLDKLGQQGVQVAGAVMAARDPSGPGGSNVTPIERANIADLSRGLCGTARAVAA